MSYRIADSTDQVANQSQDWAIERRSSIGNVMIEQALKECT